MTRQFSTYVRLGVSNVFHVALYRFLRRAGYYRRLLPIGTPVEGPFFTEAHDCLPDKVNVSYFSCHEFRLSSPPDWFLNPWNRARHEDTRRHWSELSDFDSELGDIKNIWELSRFDWLPVMAWRYRNGEKKFIRIIENWLRDWCLRNPPNTGINWKCGQEAALRCMNMLAASLCIHDSFHRPLPGFLKFLEVHLERIAPTLRYAISQDNNHGISEAAALFVAGSYLASYGTKAQRASAGRRAASGRRWLENRTEKLIMDDGSFSQHSVTYHRMVLDELCLVELLRRKLELPPLSGTFYRKTGKAVKWLDNMVDAASGDAPNLGASDGTFLFNMTGRPYRHFFSSLQLAYALFLQKDYRHCHDPHPFMELFDIMAEGLRPQEKPSSVLMKDGGYACIRHERGFAMLRLPVYRFRPGHADALHLDIWHDGTNWARDAGTYSYNCDEKLLDYFPGTAAHSTVEFDRRDQMPRLGRFLYGAWLEPDSIEYEENVMGSGYTDYLGACHHRRVVWENGRWTITDEVSGFAETAVLRWHLPDVGWHLNGKTARCADADIEVQSTGVMDMRLVHLPESPCYMKMRHMPVLEIHCRHSCEINTIFTFRD